MISAQTIVDLCNFALDAEDSDRYLFDEHFKPAINLTQKWLVKLYNRLFGDKKVSEESLYELHYIRVFKANKYSRISFPSTNYSLGKIWTITGVHPGITTIPASPTLGAAEDASSLLSDVSVVDILKSAARLTIEEWGKRNTNPVIPGSPLITNTELIEYGYLNALDYKGGYDAGSGNLNEITIAPSVAGLAVAISFLILPEDITAISDELPFPEALTELVVDKVLQLLSIKDDDSKSMYAITTEEINKAIELLS